MLATADRNKTKAKNKSDEKPLPKWQRQGFSSYNDYLYHRQSNSGTNTNRYNPRHKEPNLNQISGVSAREMSILDTLYAAIDATVERDSAYPHDGEGIHRFNQDAMLTIRLDGIDYQVQVIQRWSFLDRLRYRLRFIDQGVSLALTQQQLVRVVLPEFLQFEYRLQKEGRFTSREAFLRAKARLSANWSRQRAKLQRCCYETSISGFAPMSAVAQE